MSVPSIDPSDRIMEELRQLLRVRASRNFELYPILIGYYEPRTNDYGLIHFASKVTPFYEQCVIIYWLQSETEIMIRILARNRNEFETVMEEVADGGQIRIGDKLKWHHIGDMTYPIDDVAKHHHLEILLHLMTQHR